MRFDAVIFDMDGVLVDSERLGEEAMRRVMARHGVAYTEAENEEFLGVTTWRSCEVLRARHGLQTPEAELARQYVESLLDLIGARPVPMPGVPEVPERLARAGYRLALASSADPAVIAANLAGLGLAPLFQAVVSGVDVPRGKPAPDIFLEAAARLRARPERCLVVEDSLNGVLAAKAAGMACAAVPCASTRHQDLSAADHRLGALPDLLPILSLVPDGDPGSTR